MRRKKQIQAMQQELALLRQTIDSGKELAALATSAAQQLECCAEPLWRFHYGEHFRDCRRRHQCPRDGDGGNRLCNRRHRKHGK